MIIGVCSRGGKARASNPRAAGFELRVLARLGTILYAQYKRVNEALACCVPVLCCSSTPQPMMAMVLEVREVCRGARGAESSAFHSKAQASKALEKTTENLRFK